MSQTNNEDQQHTQFIRDANDSTTLHTIVQLPDQSAALHDRISHYFKRGSLVDWIQGKQRIRIGLNGDQMEHLFKIKIFYERYKVSSVFRQHLIQILGSGANTIIDTLIMKGYIAEYRTGNILTLIC